MKKTIIAVYKKEIPVVHNGDLLMAVASAIEAELNCSICRIRDESRKLLVATVEYADGWRLDVGIDVLSTRKVR